MYSLPLLGAEVDGVAADVHRVLGHQGRRLGVLGHGVPVPALANQKPRCGQSTANQRALKSTRIYR